MLLAGSAAVPAGARAETYAYDALGRVVSVIADDGRQTIYTYDAAGNRTTVVVSGSGAVLPPTTKPVSATYTFGASPLAINLNGYVTDPNGSGWTLTGISNPAFGTASYSGTVVTYTPPTYAGPPTDTLTYAVRNTAGLTASGVITITLNSGLAAAPVSQIFQFGSAPTLVLSPLAQASDPGAKSLSIVALPTAPSLGSASFNTTSITYTPPTSHTPGTDSFSYTIQDNTGAQSTAGISIQLTNGTPVAGPYSITVPSGQAYTSNPLNYASDPSGNGLSVHSVSQGAHGSTTFNLTTITYTANAGYSGSDNFTYTVVDPYGNVSAPATVSATVNAFTPQPITAQPISMQASPSGIGYQNACNSVTNPGGYALTLTALTTPTKGSVIQTSSCAFKYTAPAQNGTATFNYTISDPYGSTSSTVTVQISNQ